MARGRPLLGGKGDDTERLPPVPRRGLKAGVQPTRRLESKAEAFVRLANSRMPMVDEAIANVRKLANSEIYEYSPGQVDRLIGHLQSLVDSVEQAFRGGGKGSTFRIEVDTGGC